MIHEYAYVTVDVDESAAFEEAFADAKKYLLASSVDGQHLDAAIGHYFVQAPQVIHFEDTAV